MNQEIFYVDKLKKKAIIHSKPHILPYEQTEKEKRIVILICFIKCANKIKR